MLDQSNKIISGAPFTESGEDAPLWADAKRKIAGLVEQEKIDQARADELQEAAKAALLENFKPSYDALITWITSDMENIDDQLTGASNLPNGEAYYNQRLAASTTTNMTADEIHELGLSEVARLRKEMETIKEKVGFEGDLQAFFKFIREDEQFYFPNTDEGRQGLHQTGRELILGFINERLSDYFGILPKADLVGKAG